MVLPSATEICLASGSVGMPALVAKVWLIKDLEAPVSNKALPFWILVEASLMVNGTKSSEEEGLVSRYVEYRLNSFVFSDKSEVGSSSMRILFILFVLLVDPLRDLTDALSPSFNDFQTSKFCWGVLVGGYVRHLSDLWLAMPHAVHQPLV